MKLLILDCERRLEPTPRPYTQPGKVDVVHPGAALLGYQWNRIIVMRPNFDDRDLMDWIRCGVMTRVPPPKDGVTDANVIFV